MTPLGLLWLLSVALMSFSLATMAALIGARVLRKHQRTRRAARRAIVLPELIHHIGGLTGQLDLSGLERDAVLMAEAVRDLSGLVLGRERTRLTEALQVLKVDTSLRALLKSGSTNQRVLAAEALAFFPSIETYAALLRATRRESHRVRVSALRTMIELERPPPIGEMLDSVIAGGERASLLFSDLLQRAARSQIDGAVEALGRKDLPTPVRVMLLQALGASGDELALAPLREAARSPEVDIRAGALGGLGALGHSGAHQTVAEGLADTDWRVRLKAIECVRKLGLTDLFAPVMACADDEVWWVRYRAGQTLLSLADQDVAKLKMFARNAVKRSRQPSAAEPARHEPSPALLAGRLVAP